MEKRKPHYDLTTVRSLIEAGKFSTTQVARSGATMLGFNLADMLAIIIQLTQSDFYKSMTSHKDHTVWQDVYRPDTSAGSLYIKLSIVDDLLIVSFKELRS